MTWAYLLWGASETLRRRTGCRGFRAGARTGGRLKSISTRAANASETLRRRCAGTDTGGASETLRRRRAGGRFDVIRRFRRAAAVRCQRIITTFIQGFTSCSCLSSKNPSSFLVPPVFITIFCIIIGCVITSPCSFTAPFPVKTRPPEHRGWFGLVSRTSDDLCCPTGGGTKILLPAVRVNKGSSVLSGV